LLTGALPKSYLFGKLFGEDDEASDDTELKKAKADGEDAEEIDNLKKEGVAFRALRRGMGEEDSAKRVFQKVFTEDINVLLSMEDMWKVPGRVKPVPLDYGAIMNGTFPTPHGRENNAQASESKQNGTTQQANGDSQPSASTLRDQRELSLKDNLDLFIDIWA
jgi:ubiquitin-like 1-activating enzyme E1 B